MKKLVCALLAVMLCCTATFAMAEEAERSTRQSKNSMVDWSGLVTESHSGVRDVRSLFSLRLTEAQLGFLAGINLQVFELDESGSYALVSMMPEIDIDGTTYPLVKLEITNTSHPFFTGKQKLVDTAGRVDKFLSRYGDRKKKK